MKTKALLLLALLACSNAIAQNPADDKIRTTNLPEIKPLVFTNISGAPTLSQPQHIDGTLQDIRTEKHGLVYPAFFDWNHDGKKDLLLGEFETGDTGSYIKVYLNTGSDVAPIYTGEYFYATDIKGDTISNHQWCCIGIHPRIVDLDGDGYPDILSGQYNPGLISWWRGSAEGFLPRVFIEQEGYVEGKFYRGPDPTSPESNSYWNYTTADFADFDGDGLLDLFVGGSGGPRVALNVGTKESPKIGQRKPLYHTDGTVLSIRRQEPERAGNPSVWKTYLTPVDWDGDGVIDILMTHEYSKPGHNPVEFFKGVKTPAGIQFEKPRALFTAEDGSKALPGCQPMITLVDYNNDGIKDMVFAISIPTIDGFDAAPEVAWEWINDLQLQMPGKDPGRLTEWEGGVDKAKARIAREPNMKYHFLGNLDDYKYLTLRHRGYVFVMYGSENQTKAPSFMTLFSALRASADNEEGQAETDDPVSYRVELPEEITPGKEYTAKVVFSFGKDWHGYSDNKSNAAMGFLPTRAEILFPAGIKSDAVAISNTSLVYEGELSFSCKFTCPKNVLKEGARIPVVIKLQWQVCDANICLPPDNATIEKTVRCK